MGTLGYIAPEILCKKSSKESYTPLVDIWSLGVILFVMLSGTLPYVYESVEEMKKGLLHDKIIFEYELWTHRSDSG